MGDHVGAFGYRRKNHVHEGVDLYVSMGTLVSAVEDGRVVKVLNFTGPLAEPPSPWWRTTEAVMVEGASGVVLYGEVAAIAEEGWQIKAGDPIGFVIKVLMKDKGRPMSMLHLELHQAGTRDAYEWSVDGERPESLLDPTELLRGIAK